MRLAVRGIASNKVVGFLSAPALCSEAKSNAAPASAISEWVAEGGMAVRFSNESIRIP